MKRFLNLAFLFLVGGFAGCSTVGHRANSTAPIHLTATMLSPTDIKLDWTDKQKVAGHIVEWGTNPQDFVTLAFLQPDVTTFTHPDVVPETTCYYRVRPYFGPVSAPVEITTGKAIPNEEVKVADETWADPKITVAGQTGAKNSIRNSATIDEAAPTDLKAKLIHPTGIQFTWTDHANDEEGYMLEIKSDAMPDFRVCALTDSNVTSYGYALVPPETKVSFRVRAFYFGKPSNLVSEKTGLASWQMHDTKPK